MGPIIDLYLISTHFEGHKSFGSVKKIDNTSCCLWRRIKLQPLHFSFLSSFSCSPFALCSLFVWAGARKFCTLVFFCSCMLVHVGMYEEMMVGPRRNPESSKCEAFLSWFIIMMMHSAASLFGAGLSLSIWPFFPDNTADDCKIPSWIQLYRAGLHFHSANKWEKFLNHLNTKKTFFTKITLPLSLFFVVVIVIKMFCVGLGDRLDCHSV